MHMVNQSTSRKLIVCDLGLIDYKEAWDIQHQYHDLRKLNQVDDILFLCEHPHTYTLGKVAERKNLLLNDKELNEKHISVYDIDRGGDITYHGPGQLVGYPIINLELWHKDAHRYLRSLEEVMIKTCFDYDLSPRRIDKYTGVWIDNRKICAIGIKISKWVTMHGFAFNVNTNLDLFNGIIPCGISDKQITSLSYELGTNINFDEVKTKVIYNFLDEFNYIEFEKKQLEHIKS